MARTRTCTPEVRRGRLRKAVGFLDAAYQLDEFDEHTDAFVTLCVHAGIAAADVICCVRLGEHAQGENHNEAVELLQRADKGSARHLSTLLGAKSKAAYSYSSTSDDDRKRAGRAAEALVEAARRMSAG